MFASDRHKIAYEKGNDDFLWGVEERMALSLDDKSLELILRFCNIVILRIPQTCNYEDAYYYKEYFIIFEKDQTNRK